ncbi:hypothetical protein GQ44DRAFT_625039 [Phaeosphaeriaceae sp. PMI808]|nr:hypothetical protein GQ44DRAFT_625039 [Phaeosphaeriaceae sp. PMI808]
MYADHSPDCHHPDAAPSCYLSILPPPTLASFSHYSSAHFSTETPSTIPLSGYSLSIVTDPTNPLLALRSIPLTSMSNTPDASRLLQLQTAAANRPRPMADPLQHRASASSANSTSSNSSDTSTTSTPRALSPPVISCCRCRRESLMGMIQFSTNIYYCSHCARMVGYSAG